MEVIGAMKEGGGGGVKTNMISSLVIHLKMQRKAPIFRM
jgi:hypothetical protein